jgi:hypothetical protein
VPPPPKGLHGRWRYRRERAPDRRWEWLAFDPASRVSLPVPAPGQFDCWHCGVHRATHHGLACRVCRPAIDAAYRAELARRGALTLYL